MVISLQEAREILEEEGQGLSDLELQKVITTFELLARLVIDKAKQKAVASES